MSVEYERLAVLLEARVADFEKKIASATRNADRNFKKMEKSAEGMRDRMGKAFGSAGTLAKASLAGLFAGVKGYADGGYVGAMPALSPPSIPDMKSVTGGGGGGAVNVNFSPVYNVQGTGPEIAQLRAQMAKDKAEIPLRVEAAVRDARKRNVKL